MAIYRPDPNTQGWTATHADGSTDSLVRVGDRFTAICDGRLADEEFDTIEGATWWVRAARSEMNARKTN